MDESLTFATSYFFAFTMGLFSSLHCIGMCGSIIGTLTFSISPEIHKNKRKLFPFILNYNLGRILSYTIAGALVGLAQYALTWPLGQAVGHRILQILSSIFMISAGLYIAGWFPRFAYIEKAGSRLWKLIEPFGRRIIPVKNRFQAFLFGMVWGWLPCGLVYSSLAIAATSGDVQRSSLTMLAFGIGTLPAVMGVGIMTEILSKLSRMQRFKQAVGILLIVVAIFAAFPWLYPLRLQHI
ncbi:sulfite exporter TauE/SafE family protein [methane-oxidizing endosymbiont of Gigantopelta aegis]|uniref:sulfite exporter TauE/SafE family protein n=1 Tax=methane-oxidizing endosymbiont of Gigantopelta aegis TaxID=2794938 RepID=UPI001FDA7905|nr:sulfite exporter TauE/SafE family protein [methane-oxidizing endosymbiont of Gigantopelta aegis]